MKYYAIQHKETGRFVAGTDFSKADGKVHYIFASENRPPLLLGGERLSAALSYHNIDLKHYAVVVVEVGKAVL